MTSQGSPSFDSNAFWKEQDYEQSARLHLQHWIWQYQLGYALHPKIELPGSASLQIADVAAGNGAWLLEIAKNLERSKSELLGLDITTAHFPNAAWLPENVRFRVWDAYSEMPPEYEGAFDMVHLRALYSTVLDNKVDPLLSNCLKMLKPGGYLQWDESDASTLRTFSPSEGDKVDACKQVLAVQDFSARMITKMIPDWLHNLRDTLAGRGCEILVHEELEPDRRLARAWTENMLLVWRSMVALIPEQEMPLPPGMGLPEKVSRALFAALLQEAIKETQQGVMLGMQYHIFLAKKL